MRKLFFAILLAAFATPAALAQTGDYNKADVFVGFSHNRVDTGANNNDPEFDDVFDEREGFNGVNASVTGNVSRYVGLKFDYSFHQRSIDFGNDNTDFRLHNFLGGVQVKDNAKEARVKPFAHLMVGAARAAVDLTELDNRLSDYSDTSFAAAVGGGVDFRVNDRVDIRAIQFDWNPTRFDNVELRGTGLVRTGSETQHNFRIGVGVVFR